MLRYTEVTLTHEEVPGETAICIYISGCINRCEACHYPELQDPTAGMVLKDHIGEILDLYMRYATCACFMGEGDCSSKSRDELLDYVRMASERNLKSCLYSGRDVDVEKWMGVFDYVKTGSYKKERGGLRDVNTNQRFYEQINGSFRDATKNFWIVPSGRFRNMEGETY